MIPMQTSLLPDLVKPVPTTQLEPALASSPRQFHFRVTATASLEAYLTITALTEEEAQEMAEEEAEWLGLCDFDCDDFDVEVEVTT